MTDHIGRTSPKPCHVTGSGTSSAATSRPTLRHGVKHPSWSMSSTYFPSNNVVATLTNPPRRKKEKFNTNPCQNDRRDSLLTSLANSALTSRAIASLCASLSCATCSASAASLLAFSASTMRAWISAWTSSSTRAEDRIRSPKLVSRSSSDGRGKLFSAARWSRLARANAAAAKTPTAASITKTATLSTVSTASHRTGHCGSLPCRIASHRAGFARPGHARSSQSPRARRCRRRLPIRGRNAAGRVEVCWPPGAPGLTPHGPQHTYKTIMEELGTSAPLMDDHMGHSDGSVQARYSHATPEASLRRPQQLSAGSPLPSSIGC